MPQEVGQTSATPGGPRKRSTIAALFYTVLTIGALIVAIAGTPSALIGTALLGVYSVYLWRGGRFVIFFW